MIITSHDNLVELWCQAFHNLKRMDASEDTCDHRLIKAWRSINQERRDALTLQLDILWSKMSNDQQTEVVLYKLRY